MVTGRSVLGILRPWQSECQDPLPLIGKPYAVLSQTGRDSYRWDIAVLVENLFESHDYEWRSIEDNKELRPIAWVEMQTNGKFASVATALRSEQKPLLLIIDEE